jgi:hypothetical protein
MNDYHTKDSWFVKSLLTKDYRVDDNAILLDKTMHWKLYYNDEKSRYMLHNIMTGMTVKIGYMDDTYQIIQLMETMRSHETETQKIVEREWLERKGEAKQSHIKGGK